MAEMDQVGRARGDGPGGLQCLIEIHVGRMRCLPQRVENENLGTVRRLHGLTRHPGAVGEVGKQLPSSPMENITRRGEPPVRQINGHDRCLAQLEGARDLFRVDAEIVLPDLGFVEDIAKRVPESLHRGR